MEGDIHSALLVDCSLNTFGIRVSPSFCHRALGSL